MWLLVADLVRRQYRWPVLSAAGAAGVMWFVIAGLAEDVASAFAVSIGATFVIGPLMTIASGSRVVLYLPVSRREVWHATWFVATIVSTVAATLVKLPAAIAMLIAGDGVFGMLALSGVYDLTAAATACALMTFAMRPPDVNHPWRMRLLGLLAIVGFVGGALAVLSLHEHLPTRWSHLSPANVGMLVAILAAAAVTFANPPRTAARVGPARRIRERAAGYRESRAAGMPQLLVNEFVWTITMALTLGLSFALIAFVGSTFMGQGPASLIEFLRAQHLLIFERTSEPMTASRPISLLIWFAFFTASLAARFPELLRHLRVLPIGQSSLIALLVMWPAAIWMAFWAGLLALHVSVGSDIRNVHPDLWIRFVAVSALTQSLGLWLTGRYRWVFQAWPAVFLPLLPLASRAPASIGMPLAIFALAGAIVVTRAALARNTTYTHVPAVEASPAG
jgi:hypothetical protein